MNNLMPPDKRESILYARRNSIMIKWMIMIAVAACGILIVAGGGLFFLNQDIKNYTKSIDTSQANLSQQDEKETLERVEEMSGNLSLVVDVLSNQVLFSELLQHVGQVIPQGAVLQDLSISNTLEGGIDLTLGTINEEAATQAQVNLSDPENAIFVKADIVSLSCSADSAGAEVGYPCTVSIRALFDKDNNPFLLLNQKDAN